MAKKTLVVAVGTPSGPETVRITLPKGQKLAGTPGLLAHGKRVCVKIEGKVTGHTVDELGGSITLEPTEVRIEKPGYDGEGEPMTAMMQRMSGKKGVQPS